jgi:hypothetical protein
MGQGSVRFRDGTSGIRTIDRGRLPPDPAVTICAFMNAPHTSHTEQFIVTALRNAELLTISLVADAEGTVRRGVGTCLLHEALRRLREHGAAGCVVLGEPEYYLKRGGPEATSHQAKFARGTDHSKDQLDFDLRPVCLKSVA